MTTLAAYQNQNSSLTLKQGLEEYYALNPNLIDASTCNNSEVATLFERHDIIHVLFGCSTSLHDETLADTWTIFGSTVKFWDYVGYLKYAETTDVLGEFTILFVVRELIKALPDLFRVIGRTRKMTQKWDWANYQGYLDSPLKQLRQDYGIQVLSSDSSLQQSVVQA